MFSWCGFPSSLSTHLSGTHHITKDIAMKHNEEELKNLSTSSIKSHHPFKQESLTKNVVAFVIGTVQPLSIVEDPDFINIINGFDKYYKVPYTWSSPAHLPYLGATAHWVTSKFEPHEILLSMAELPYPHGSTEIKEHLFDLFNEWEIESKISAIVTDNGSNQQLKESQIYLYRQQEILQETEELEKEVENLICLDVVKANNTRWNSILYAFQRLIVLKPAISMLKASLMSDTSSYIHK
ncbi:hypothetical protein RclHR1_34300001 [Rhizophagus clarus]|uniref:HAT C-terminal dimerisation domain-containing protein n=1 Tax=Rhizophagus clarus TaxID=94130 RepID=A0A2Z6S4F8_9GLOM|nr:hypothetical protein RclHR1_34300001 [Rhizophagus clarus]